MFEAFGVFGECWWSVVYRIGEVVCCACSVRVFVAHQLYRGEEARASTTKLLSFVRKMYYRFDLYLGKNNWKSGIIDQILHWNHQGPASIERKYPECSIKTYELISNQGIRYGETK